MPKNDNVILMKLACIECKEKYDFDEIITHKEHGETFHVCPFCEDEFKAKKLLLEKIMNSLSGSHD